MVSNLNMRGENQRMTKIPFLNWTLALAFGLGLGHAAAPGKAHAASDPSHEQITGAWLIEKPVFALRTADGQEPPLKPDAAKIYQERQTARAKGDTSFDSATWCASLGMPRMLLVDYPFEIVVGPKEVAFLHQWNWWARLVYLPGALDKDASAPPPPGIGGPPGGPPGAPPGAGTSGEQEVEPTPTGFSQGKWEGDVQTIVNIGEYRGVVGTLWWIIKEEGTREIAVVKTKLPKGKGKIQEREAKGQGMQGLWRGWRVGMWGLVGIWGSRMLSGGGNGGEF